jgi:hypothetical protein
MPVDSLPLKYECWATAEEDEKPAKGQNRWGEVVNMIKAGLSVSLFFFLPSSLCSKLIY